LGAAQFYRVVAFPVPRYLQPLHGIVVIVVTLSALTARLGCFLVTRRAEGRPPAHD